jgi:two-component system cell cycle response regulator
MDIMRSAGMMFVNVFSRIMQRKLAVTDALTGVHNRRYFMEAAEIELQRCIDRKSDYALIMADIDNFKTVNDRYGHSVGDEVLKIFAARLKNALKHSTLIYRYGGEEFIITLPGVSSENAIKTDWRLQKVIAASSFQIDDLELSITASFGVASMIAQRSTLIDITNNADKALYMAKSKGKNTVVGAGDSEES